MLVSSVRVYHLNGDSPLMRAVGSGVAPGALRLAAGALRMECEDTARDYMKDEHGKGCAFYAGRDEECGYHDNDVFFANTMCCVCGGGLAKQPAFETGGSLLGSRY